MNLKMNIFRIANLGGIIGLLFVCIYSSHAQETGKVQISSLNLEGEIVPFINVIIEGKGFKRELETVGVGDEYENSGLIELPIGIYRITSKNGNYYPFRRSEFLVESGKVIKINVFPVLQVLMQALVLDERGMRDEYQFAPPPKYSSFKVPNTSDTPLDLLIRYDGKQSRKGVIEYTGNQIVGGAMVSYNTLAIYAKRFRFNEKRLRLEAEDNVILEDGKNRISLNKVVVSFENGVPKITQN